MKDIKQNIGCDGVHNQISRDSDNFSETSK